MIPTSYKPSALCNTSGKNCKQDLIYQNQRRLPLGTHKIAQFMGKRHVNTPEEEDAGACLMASWVDQPGPRPPEEWGPCTMAGCLTSQSCCLPGIQRWAQRQPASQCKYTLSLHQTETASVWQQQLMMLAGSSMPPLTPHSGWYRCTQTHMADDVNKSEPLQMQTM